MKTCDQCNRKKKLKEFKSKTKVNNICNDCKTKNGKIASIKGAANEYLVLGALICDFPNIMMSSSAQTAHDLIIHKNNKVNYRIQVKTVSSTNSISLKGGGRSGRDANYGGPGTINKIYSYTS